MRILFLTIVLTACFHIGYAADQSSDPFRDAEYYCESIRPQFEKIAKTYQLNTEQVLPIVFPESMRFSEYSDQLETTALTYLYVLEGKDGADFSIGRFQMKPSFIESLEGELLKSKLPNQLKKRFIYGSGAVKSIRSERVTRLADPEWQMHYLCVFYRLMEERTDRIKWNDDEEKLSFFAAAYNYGFLHPTTQIKHWEHHSNFPVTVNDQPMSYAEIAVYYFTKCE